MKILHTADLHIGMKFSRYPDEVRERLIGARTQVLDNLIDSANREDCQIFAIAGDLFESSKINKSLVGEVLQILGRFEGECVLVLPGNHDFYDGISDLWKRFIEGMDDKVILLNQNRIFNLEPWGLPVNIYPAGCNQKHSANNNLGWINQLGGDLDNTFINIGMAHGALEGTSADLEGSYYLMSRQELDSIPVDLWLLGHAHVRYPDLDDVFGERLFISGTPEPDGINYVRQGNAWLIEIGEDKKIKARSIVTGQFRFLEVIREIRDEGDFRNLNEYLLSGDPDRKLVRLQLSGRIDEALMEARSDYYRQWAQRLLYLSYDDSRLHRRIGKETIEREFTHNSFPYRWLQKLADDPEALQMAYDLIRQVK